MLREDYKIIREQALKFKHETMEKSNAAGLHWVLCLWESPITPKVVQKRVGYFENITEAEHMKQYLIDKYREYQFPFYIITSYCDVEDGGLFEPLESSINITK